MRALAQPLLIALGVALLVIALALALALPGGSPAVTTLLAWILIALAAADLWMTVLLWRTHRRHPDIPLLQRDFEWAVIITTAALLFAALSANFLFGNPLPRGAGFVFLACGVVLASVPLARFLIAYYRGRL